MKNTKIFHKSVVARVTLIAVLTIGAAPAERRAAMPSTPELGKAAGRCRRNELGPALLVEVKGLKDRQGLLKLEVYPSDDQDFLAPDNILITEHKTFRRVEERTPLSGAVTLCIRVPGPGAYSVMLLHDRDSNHKFSLWVDGIGFPGNPSLGWHKPGAAQTRLTVGNGLTRASIVLNYRHGLGMSPIRSGE